MFNLKELNNIRAALAQGTVAVPNSREAADLWDKVNANIERLTREAAQAAAPQRADEPA